MAKKLNEIKLKELSRTRDWIQTILDFMISKNGETHGLKMFSEVVNDSFQKQNLKGLRYVVKDVNEWAKGMSQSNIDELNLLLRNKFGEDLIKNSSKDLRKLNRVIKKGNISNEEEYRLLLNRVDEIYADDNKRDEIKTLNKLLADFHKK